MFTKLDTLLIAAALCSVLGKSRNQFQMILGEARFTELLGLIKKHFPLKNA